MSPISIKEDQNVEGLRFSSLLPSPLKLLLSYLLILICCTGLHAQWPEDGGLDIGDGLAIFDMVPDKVGGVWLLFMTQGGRTIVQRIDQDGYRQFPGDGFLLTDDGEEFHVNWFLSKPIVRSDSTLLVLFNNRDRAPEYGWNLYAQRFSLDGERLFGPEGVPIAQEEFSQESLGSGSWSNVVASDGADGAWVLYTRPTSYEGHIYLSGVNADGSMKDLGAQYVDSLDTYSRFYTLCHDGADGAWVVFIHDRDTVTRHVSGNGEVSGRYVVHDGDGRPANSTSIMPDHSGGFHYVYTTSEAFALFQRIYSDGSRQFEDYGIRCWFNTTGNGFPSQPVEMGQDTFVTVCGNADFHFARFTPDLFQSIVQEEIGLFHYYIGETRDALCGSPELGYLFGVTTFYNQDRLTKNTAVFKIDIEGNNLWESNGVFLNEWSSQWPNSEGNMNLMYACMSGDSSAIVGTLFDVNSSGMRRLTLYKVTPDGRVEGRDPNPVLEQEANHLPRDFRISGLYPNPFNTSLRMGIDVPANGVYTLKVYDVLGRLLDSVEYDLKTGSHQLEWTAKPAVSSGIVLLVWSRQQTLAIKKAVYLK